MYNKTHFEILEKKKFVYLYLYNCVNFILKVRKIMIIKKKKIVESLEADDQSTICLSQTGV